LYYISFIADYSNQMHFQFLKLKSKALNAFKAYEAWLGHQLLGAKLHLSAEFDQHLHQQGIEHQLTVHDSPQQNGVAEHLN
jgi:hypothetical protein